MRKWFEAFLEALVPGYGQNKSSDKIQFDNWGPVLYDAAMFSIFENADNERWGIEVSLFFDSGDRAAADGIALPLAVEFATAGDAFIFVKSIQHLFLNTLDDITVFDKGANLLCKLNMKMVPQPIQTEPLPTHDPNYTIN